MRWQARFPGRPDPLPWSGTGRVACQFRQDVQLLAVITGVVRVDLQGPTLGSHRLVDRAGRRQGHGQGVKDITGLLDLQRAPGQSHRPGRIPQRPVAGGDQQPGEIVVDVRIGGLEPQGTFVSGDGPGLHLLLLKQVAEQ